MWARRAHRLAARVTGVRECANASPPRSAPGRRACGPGKWECARLRRAKRDGGSRSNRGACARPKARSAPRPKQRSAPPPPPRAERPPSCVRARGSDVRDQSRIRRAPTGRAGQFQRRGRPDAPTRLACRAQRASTTPPQILSRLARRHRWRRTPRARPRAQARRRAGRPSPALPARSARQLQRQAPPLPGSASTMRGRGRKQGSCSLYVLVTASKVKGRMGAHEKPMRWAEEMWCLGPESNQRHADFQSAALPTELPRRPDRAGGCL